MKIDAGLPKLGEEQKKNKKKSSFKFGPIFCPKIGEEQKKNKKKRLSFF